MLDYRIDGDALYGCQANSVERIVPWGSAAGAWRRVASAWLPFIPEIDVAALEVVPPPGAASSPRWLRRAAACRFLMRRWPSEAREAVCKFPSAHWQLLQLVNRGGEAALDLLRSNPALGYLAARNNAADELGLRRRSLAALFGFPETEHAVRLLHKVPAAWTSVELLDRLREAMTQDRDAEAVLTHLERINPIALDVARDAALRESVAPACLARLCRVPASASQCDLVARIRDNRGSRIRTLADIDRPAARPPAPAPPRPAQRAEFRFPSPPLADLYTAGARIAAVRSHGDLQGEGRAMHHCAGSDISYARRVADGDLYFYRMLEPERLTIAIRPARGGWTVEEVRGIRNREPRAQSRAIIRGWLGQVVESPAPAVAPRFGVARRRAAPRPRRRLPSPNQLAFNFV